MDGMKGAILGLIVAFCLPGCAAQPSNEPGLTVLASVSPIAELVQSIAGSRLAVEALIPEGVDSHTFEPAPKLASRLSGADLVFVNGLHLETPLIEMARSNLEEGAQIVMLGDVAIDRDEWIYDQSFPQERGDPNPHLWTNPLHALRYTHVIRDHLIAADPEGAEVYRKNHFSLQKAIQDLDRAIRTATQTVPAESRKLVTYHDSFPYFAREYGWQVIFAVQPSDFSEPTAREIAELIEQLKVSKVPAIFGSEVFPSTILETIARETGVEYISDLRDDDLPGSRGDPEHSYIGLMRFNLKTIIAALGGDPSAIEAVRYEKTYDD